MSVKRKSEASGGEKPRKVPKQYTEAEIKLAKDFDNLADEDGHVRIEAAISLVEFYVANGAPEKILNRLIRGVCSGRKAARLGFFTALVEVLKHVARTGDGLNDVLAKIKDLTGNESGASKQEKKDNSIGCLAGLSAVVHSHLLFLTPFDHAALESFVKISIVACHKRPQLYEQCGRLWVDMIEVASALSCYEAIDALVKQLHNEKWLLTPEGVAVWVRAHRLSKHIRFPANVWYKNNPFNSNDKSTLSRALQAEHLPAVKERAEDQTEHENESYEIDISGAARRQPHFVFDIMFQDLVVDKELIYREKVKSNKKNKPNSKSERNFEHLWQTIDSIFFKESSSAERKALGLKIFESAISTIPDNFFQHTLTANLIECLTSNLSNTHSILHEAALSVLKAMQKRVAGEEYHSSLAYVLSACTKAIKKGPEAQSQSHGKELEKSRALLKSLLGAASEGALHEIVPQLEMYFVSNMSYLGKFFDEDRYLCISIFTGYLSDVIAKLASLKNDNDTFLAFSVLLRAPTVAVDSKSPPKVHNMLHSGLWRSFQVILENVDLSEDRQDPMLHGLISMFLRCITGTFIKTLGFDEHELQKVVRAGNILLNIEDALNSGRSNHPIHKGFAILLIISLFEIILMPSRAHDLIETVNYILDDIIEVEKSVETNDIIRLASTVEILLSYCSKPEGAFKVAVEKSFAMFAEHLSSHDIAPLIDVLGQEENLAGQRELFDQQSEKLDDEDSDSSDGSDMSDVEVIDQVADNGIEETDLASSTKSEDEESDDDNDDDEDDDEDEDDSDGEDNESGNSSDANAADEALNDSLGQILGTISTKKVVKSTNEDNGDNSSDTSGSDSDMTDGEMERLNIDEQLTTIFKQRQQAQKGAYSSTNGARANGTKVETQKTQQKDAKRLIVMFKTRVLSLLGIYIEIKHSSPDSLTILLPLCHLIGSTRNAAVARKSSDLLEKYIRLCKRKRSSDSSKDSLPIEANPEEVFEMLKNIHEEALLFKSKAHASACSRASLFLGRVLLAITQQRNEGDNSKKQNGQQAQIEPKTIIIKLSDQYTSTRDRKRELNSELPEIFWENFRVWLTSMGF